MEINNLEQGWKRETWESQTENISLKTILINIYIYYKTQTLITLGNYKIKRGKPPTAVFKTPH